MPLLVFALMLVPHYDSKFEFVILKKKVEEMSFGIKIKIYYVWVLIIFVFVFACFVVIVSDFNLETGEKAMINLVLHKVLSFVFFHTPLVFAYWV